MIAEEPTITTYTIGYDPETGETVADAGGQEYASKVPQLAWQWLAHQILADDE